MERRDHSTFGSRLLALTRKEFRQLVRDPSNFAIGIVLPIVLILIFGFGISLDVKNAPVAVVLEDPSRAAQDVIAGLRETPYIAPRFSASIQAAEQLILAHAVDGIVRVPSDFSRQLSAGHATVQLIVHGADASTARIVESYVTGALATWSAHQSERSKQPANRSTGQVRLATRQWFNAANDSTWYLVPGLIVLVMTLVGAFLTALTMAREWERGTLEALFVSPVRPAEILIAKLIPVFCIGLLGFTFCLIAAHWIFHVPFLGSGALLVVASCLYLLVALGIGLVISSVTKNQFLASQVALIASFLPAMMLSGFLFDLRNVPPFIRWIGKVLPATHFLELIRSLYLAGTVWSIVLPEMAIIAAYAVIFLIAARVVTQKRLL